MLSGADGSTVAKFDVARVVRLAAGTLTLALVLAACGGDDDSDADADGGGGEATAGGGATDLSGVCPSPFIIQTNWDPESEYAGLYQMLGDDYAPDTDVKSVTGSLMAGDEDTGIDLEIRVGGPAIGYQQVSAQMYADTDIHMGQVNSDSAVAFAADQPTVMVVSPLEISPFMLMWDPETHPEFNTITDIGQTDTTVLYFETDTYMSYLTGSGILREAQIDGSYDGSPDRWVAEDGGVVQAGFATSEPYVYEHEIDAWGKAVDYGLIHDTGYPLYPQALSVRGDDLEELSPCLERLVPIIQQSQVDFISDPGRTNALIIALVEEFDTGWTYSEGLASYAVEAMKAEGIVGNGNDDTLGNFDMDRVQEIIDIVNPILRSRNDPVVDELAPEDIATNEFIDDSITYDVS